VQYRELANTGFAQTGAESYQAEGGQYNEYPAQPQSYTAQPAYDEYQVQCIQRMQCMHCIAYYYSALCTTVVYYLHLLTVTNSH
jgi:hypothetical protein